jgi:hypothetical protein
LLSHALRESADWRSGAPEPHPQAATIDDLENLTCDDAGPLGAEEFLVERDGFRIRAADTQHHRSRVSMLIDRMYAWRGYHWELQNGLAHHPNRITLQATVATQLAGTLTLGLDSPAGLLADSLYKDEIDAVREEIDETTGKLRRVCELAHLAIDPTYGSKEMLASLFHIAYVYGRLLHRVTDVFIEVNPRHVLFYRRMLGFRPIGQERVCERVQAPAMLLRLELAYVDEQIERYGGHRGRGVRSLYPYFFSRVDEEGLRQRIFSDFEAAPPARETPLSSNEWMRTA